MSYHAFPVLNVRVQANETPTSGLRPRFVLSALMHNIRTGMDNHVQDPLSVPRIRLQLSTASRDIILLRETLTYLSESTHAMTLPPFPKDLVGIRLW